jgi:stage V sporulation protein G
VDVTEVRVKLASSRSEKLKAFATITLDDCFVVRDIKIISGTRGLFVAMPSRRLNARCPRCHCKNHLRAKYCSECGKKLSQAGNQLDDRGCAKLYADTAHPVNQACRSILQKAILEAYERELERSKQAGYRPPSDEYPEDAGPGDIDDLGTLAEREGEAEEATSSGQPRPSGGAAPSAPRDGPDLRPATSSEPESSPTSEKKSPGTSETSPGSSAKRRRDADGDENADGGMGIFA